MSVLLAIIIAHLMLLVPILNSVTLAYAYQGILVMVGFAMVSIIFYQITDKIKANLKIFQILMNVIRKLITVQLMQTVKIHLGGSIVSVNMGLKETALFVKVWRYFFVNFTYSYRICLRKFCKSLEFY